MAYRNGTIKILYDVFISIYTWRFDMRIQFKVSKEKSIEIDGLMEKTGSETRRELLNSALTLLKWVLDERQKGNIISSVNEEDKVYKELVMPCLNVPVQSS